MLPKDLTNLIIHHTTNPNMEIYPTVILKNIPKNSTKKSITKMCKKYGKISMCLVGPDYPDKTKISASVIFKNEVDAIYAVSQLHKSQIFEGCDQPMTAKIGRRERYVFVSNLPDKFSGEILREIFCQFGVIEHLWVLQDDEENWKMSRCFAVIEFKNVISADKAVDEMDGFVLDGYRLEVKLKGDYQGDMAKKETVVEIPMANTRTQQTQRQFEQEIIIAGLLLLIGVCLTFLIVYVIVKNKWV